MLLLIINNIIDKFKLKSSWFIPNQTFAYSFLKDLTFLKIKENSANGNKSLFFFKHLTAQPDFASWSSTPVKSALSVLLAFVTVQAVVPCCLDLASCSFLCSSSSCRRTEYSFSAFSFKNSKALPPLLRLFLVLPPAGSLDFFSRGHALHGLLSAFFSCLFIL